MGQYRKFPGGHLERGYNTRRTSPLAANNIPDPQQYPQVYPSDNPTLRVTENVCEVMYRLSTGKSIGARVKMQARPELTLIVAGPMIRKVTQVCH